MSWLNLTALAFGTIYGGDAAARLGFKGEALPPAAPVVKPAAPTPQPAPKHPFMIDKQGYVKNAKGKRLMPSDITDIIVDLRGIDGDMKTITWADDSQGLNGADLTIVGG